MGRSLPEIRYHLISENSRLWRDQSPEGALYEICLGRFHLVGGKGLHGEEASVVKFKESLISAHHNYLVNQMLTPGFILGELNAQDDFWLLADVVLPEERPPFLSGRFYDSTGAFLLEIRDNEVVQNPGRCILDSSADGFRVLHPSGDLLMAVRTEAFANGYLTRIQGKLYDKRGLLRMEPSFESARVFGEVQWALDTPEGFRKKNVPS
jgi:hypothetical protein